MQAAQPEGGAVERTYLAIDLKSFYASAECVARGLDPLRTHLVVADQERSDRTICLAVSPSLKAAGVSSRPRLFEVVQKADELNRRRRRFAPGGAFSGSSPFPEQLAADPALSLSYIVAPPRMAYYIEQSAKVYQVYLRYIAPEDIHVYSVDEVFMDITGYLALYRMNAHDLARKMIRDVLAETGITATAGIGPNLYLAKVAMDIEAKHLLADADGVRIAELDEMAYRRQLWGHQPLSDFWRVGRATQRKLNEMGLYTMGDVARCSLGPAGAYHSEDTLFKVFGVNAELLIDHAWGHEPVTLAQIKAYRPADKSLAQGQVLPRPYRFAKARLVVWEMAQQLAEDLLEKQLVAGQLVLQVGYDRASLEEAGGHAGPVDTDYYGWAVPPHARGSANLSLPTSSAYVIGQEAQQLFDRICDEHLLVRRMSIGAARVQPADEAPAAALLQPSLFDDQEALEQQLRHEEAMAAREQSVQEAAVAIKRRFGKNAVLRAANLQEGATAPQRNQRIGGHRA